MSISDISFQVIFKYLYLCPNFDFLLYFVEHFKFIELHSALTFGQSCHRKN